VRQILFGKVRKKGKGKRKYNSRSLRDDNKKGKVKDEHARGR
jgi:hypothetical protein